MTRGPSAFLGEADLGPRITYLGRSRVGKDRANLIQTLRTVEALEGNGHATRLVLPAWHRRTDAEKLFRRFGVERELEVEGHPGMNSRLDFAPYLDRHRNELRSLRGRVYCRYAPIALACLERRIGCVLEVHSLRRLEGEGSLPALLNAHRAGTLRSLVTINATDRDAFAAEGLDPERLFVAHSGVDVAAYRDVPPPRFGEAPRVAYIGQLSEDRGLGLLVELHRRGVIRLELVGAADDAATVPALPGLKRSGFVDPARVPALYGRCDLVLLPYRPDLAHAGSISPIKLFEAMAAGRPVIASDLPTIAEVVRDGENGLLVPPGDPDAWAAAVQRLVEDPALAAQLAATARTEVPAYDWSARAETVARSLGLPPTAPPRAPEPLGRWWRDPARTPRERQAADRELGRLLGATVRGGRVPERLGPDAVEVAVDGRLRWADGVRLRRLLPFRARRGELVEAGLALRDAAAAAGIRRSRSGLLRLREAALRAWPEDPPHAIDFRRGPRS